jgi:polyamine oxidase
MLTELSRRRFLQLVAAAGGATAVPSRSSSTPQDYDDGNLAIPTGIAGDVERVIVVGAGFAGLSAANALRNAGVEAVVLEGRDRLGGRTWTRDVGGVPVDLGASWIHTPVGNPMSRFADQAGVGRVPVPVTNNLLATESAWDSERGIWLPRAELVPSFIGTAIFENALPELRAALGPSATLEEAIVQHLLERNLDAPLDRYVDFAIRLIAGAESSLPADEISLQWYFGYGTLYGGSEDGDFPIGGYRTLVEAMAQGLDVRLGETVTGVAYDSGGVEVTTEHAIHNGSHVIVSVPLGVLKAGDVAFSPSLPAGKLLAIDRLGFGYFEKVALRFDDAFWRASGERTDFLYASARTRLEFPLYVDLTNVVGAPALVMLTSGEFAKSLTGVPAAVRIARVMEILREIHGPQVPDPLEAFATDWAGDPFTRGAYSYPSPGSSPFDFDVLAEPVDGRLLFAGEATTQARNGYADGAMMTGIREAKRLLGTPTVLLPEPRGWALAGAAGAAVAALAWWGRRASAAPDLRCGGPR